LSSLGLCRVLRGLAKEKNGIRAVLGDLFLLVLAVIPFRMHVSGQGMRVKDWASPQLGNRAMRCRRLLTLAGLIGHTMLIAIVNILTDLNRFPLSIARLYNLSKDHHG
jgi:hypothetical protein